MLVPFRLDLTLLGPTDFSVKLAEGGGDLIELFALKYLDGIDALQYAYNCVALLLSPVFEHSNKLISFAHFVDITKTNNIRGL